MSILAGGKPADERCGLKLGRYPVFDGGSLCSTHPANCPEEVAMSNPPGPPFRADHVGSLLRPEPLLAARAEHEKGWITAETLRGCEDDCIKKAVAMQAE